MVTATPRKTAEEREEILDAALTEFADHGFEGSSTDAIARVVGISQPYLFRLFGTKKGLYLASAERCLADTYDFSAAAEGLSGEEALTAIGRSYKEMITADPRRLKAQMQAYAASDDPDVRRRSAWLRPARRARRSTGASQSAWRTSSRSACSSTS